MFVFHAKLKFAEIYETQLDKIELLLNSEILENHQKISKIANDDVLQAQILITKNT